MKKSCYTCKFYGKCLVTNYVCNEWEEESGALPLLTLNIIGFDGQWRGLHKKWYRRFDLQLTAKRVQANDRRMRGEDTEAYLADALRTLDEKNREAAFKAAGLEPILANENNEV